MWDEKDQREIKILTAYFLNFIRSPVATLKTLPQVDWIPLLVVQVFSAAIACLLQVLFTRNLIHMFLSIFFVPITLVFCTYLISFIIVGYFKIFERREMPFLSIYTLVVISIIPYVVAFPFFPLFPPLAIVACFFSALSIIVGLVENFGVERRKAVRIIGVLVALFVTVWVINAVISQENLRDLTMPGK